MERFRFDAKEREVMRKQLHVENSFVIGNIGRLCYQKNQDFLIDVLAQVKRIIPNAKLLLVGEGEMLTALQEKVDRLGVSADVISVSYTHLDVYKRQVLIHTGVLCEDLGCLLDRLLENRG